MRYTAQRQMWDGKLLARAPRPQSAHSPSVCRTCQRGVEPAAGGDDVHHGLQQAGGLTHHVLRIRRHVGVERGARQVRLKWGWGEGGSRSNQSA